VCSVSFIAGVALCAVFCLSVVCYFVWYVQFCVVSYCSIQPPLGRNPFAVQLNNNNNNNNNN
jgi:hypothetical protein